MKARIFFGSVMVLGGHVISLFTSNFSAESLCLLSVVGGLALISYPLWKGELGSDLQD